MVFSDPTDNLAGGFGFRSNDGKNPDGLVIHFKHVASGATAEFKAFLENFSDDYSSDWNKQEVFGRMDEIQTFKKTIRVINVSWTVPSYSQAEAISNYKEIMKMTTMLYPVYEDVAKEPGASSDNVVQDLNKLKDNLINLNIENKNNFEAISGEISRIENFILSSNRDTSNLPKNRNTVSIVSSPPILQMKFKNWASSKDGNGLYGTIEGFSVVPVIDEGTFLEDGLLIPMTHKCSAVFTVIHTDPLGWSKDKKLRSGER